jgi:hypothetical protein
MILRKLAQDCVVDLVITQFGLVLFEAEAPQPTPLSVILVSLRVSF